MLRKGKKTTKEKSPIERTSANVVTIRFDAPSVGWEKWILLRSDAHHDHPKCDQALEKKHLDQALDRDALIIDNGDLFCAMQGKYDKRSDKSALRPEHAKGDYLDALVRTAAEFYRPYAANFAVLGLGNHETAIIKNHETSLTDRLAERMKADGSPVLVSGYGGWVRFMFTSMKTQRQSVILHHYHGSGGGGPVTHGIIETNRITVYTPDPHIVLTGHSHTEWTLTLPRQRISNMGELFHDEQIHVRVPGYKDAWADGSKGFEVERRHGPKPRGAAWLRFWLERDRIHYEVSRAK